MRRRSMGIILLAAVALVACKKKKGGSYLTEPSAFVPGVEAAPLVLAGGTPPFTSTLSEALE